MYAIRQHEFGPAETLLYEEVPDPVPAEGQVCIAVEAAGVHPIDTAIRRGEKRDLPVPDLPMVPGREVAGTVDAVGPGVDRSWSGRRVVGHLGPASGGYAERAVAPVVSLHEVPEDLAADAAVAAIGTGRTAVAILEVAALASEDVVIVTGAPGGLGDLLVQGALGAGASVVGVEGPVGDEGATVVLDGVGGSVGRQALALLGVGGRLILFGWSSGEPTVVSTEDLMVRGLTVSWALGQASAWERQRELETRAIEEIASGRLAPPIESFALAEAAAAHEAVEARPTACKTVLLP